MNQIAADGIVRLDSQFVTLATLEREFRLVEAMAALLLFRPVALVALGLEQGLLFLHFARRTPTQLCGER